MAANSPSSVTAGSWRSLWLPIVLVAAALIFAMVASVVVWRLEATRLSPAQPVSTARLTAAAVFQVDKPPVAVSIAASQAPLARALLLYRDDRYRAAAQALAAVARSSPGQPEPWFYLGVSRLFLGDNQAAAASFARASELASGSLAQSADWYRAVALVRANQVAAAEPLFQRLCASGGLYATRACQAAALETAHARGHSMR
ncbi:MAG TPA: hypothetical protein VE996_10635 [Terriglobales bacterium]|nr:hypothetical protein [Terriglobales bacterium]